MRKTKLGSWKLPLLVSFFFYTLLTEIYFSGGLNYYFTRNLGLSLELEATLWAVFVVLSCFISIFAGIISDRYVGHSLGRRIPFLRLCGLLFGVFFALAFLPPPFGTSQAGLGAYYLLMFTLLCSTETFVLQAIYSIPSEEITDKRSRGILYSLTGIVSFLGFFVGLFIILPSIQPEPGESLTIFRIIMAALGLGASIIFFISSFFLPHTFVQNPEIVQNSPPISSFLECLKNKTFIIGEIYLTSVVTCTMTLILSIQYFMDEFNSASIVTISGTIFGAVAEYLFFRKCYTRIPSRVLFGLSGVVSAVMLFSIGLRPEIPACVFLGCFGAGITATIQYTVNSIIVTDSVDSDALVSHFRKEAEYYSLDALFDCLGGLSQSVFLLIISDYGYIVGLNAGEQSASAKAGIAFGGIILPAVILLIGSLVMLFFYPVKKGEATHETVHE